MRGSKSVAKKAMAQPSEPISFGMNVPKHKDPYEVESAARALERHSEVKSDKKLHRAAKAHLRKKHRAIGKVLKEK